MTMACRGLDSFWGRGRHIRSIRWLPVFAVTVILTNLPTSAVSQNCSDGTYLPYDPSQHQTAQSLSGTTSSWVETTTVPQCRNCNESIEHCTLCKYQTRVICNKCKSGYEPTNNNTNCTAIQTSPDTTSETKKIIIGVVVGVLGVLIVVGIIVGIVLGVRRGTCAKCDCSCGTRSPSPPPMPPPDQLGLSFTKKDEEQSGTGQRVDLRYTGDPGTTQRRVESVHYDGYKGPGKDDSVYANSLSLNNPTSVQEESDAVYINPDDQTDELYINAGSMQPLNNSSTDKPKTTPAQGSNKRGPPPPKTKPKTLEKPTPVIMPNTNAGNRGSLFPPTESEDIYTNEADPDEDDEDYVNSESYQPRKP